MKIDLTDKEIIILENFLSNLTRTDIGNIVINQGMIFSADEILSVLVKIFMNI